MLARQHPVSLSPLSLFTVLVWMCASPDHPMSPAPFFTVIRIWLKNLIFKVSYTLFYNKLYCKSQTHLTRILGVHVYNSSKAFNVNEFSQKWNVRKRKLFFFSLSLFLSFFVVVVVFGNKCFYIRPWKKCTCCELWLWKTKVFKTDSLLFSSVWTSG